MSRKEFSHLLKKYDEGTCTEEERLFVEHWYAITRNEEREPLEDTDLDSLEPTLWKAIQGQIRDNEESDSVEMSRKLPVYRWLGIAASVVILIGVFIGIKEKQLPGDGLFGKSGWETRVNNSTKEITVTLPDGSEVKLSPKASVEYRIQQDGDKREVYLSGDAFFKVEKMPARPFYVYTGNVVTKVLGTSFFVKAGQNASEVSVEVVTGRVAVFRKSAEKNEELVITPNQKAVYEEVEKSLTAGLVEIPTLIQEEKTEKEMPAFEFQDLPLSAVVAVLEKAYGIDIQLEKEKIKDCPLTASLAGFTLYQQLDMICAATKTHYARQGTVIRIGGEGCAHMQ